MMLWPRSIREPIEIAMKITQVSGRALPLRGNELDTDRIMPARFLKAVTFEGLEQHVFEDDRKTNPNHPFSNATYDGAAILVVNENFGCGSSREHAPQGLLRWGIKAIVGESFSEIFRGNSSVLGVPCFTADKAAIEKLQSLIEQQPDTVVKTDVATGTVTAGDVTVQATLPAGVRDAFLTDKWNPTSMLLADFDQVRTTAAKLPYVAGFSRRHRTSEPASSEPEQPVHLDDDRPRREAGIPRRPRVRAPRCTRRTARCRADTPTGAARWC